MQHGLREAGARTTPSLRQVTAQSHHSTIFYQLQTSLPMSPRLTLQQSLMLTPARLPSPQTWWCMQCLPDILFLPLLRPPEAETPQLPVAGIKTEAGSGASASLSRLPVAILFPQLIPFILSSRRGRGSVGGALAWQAQDMSSIPGTHMVWWCALVIPAQGRQNLSEPEMCSYTQR